MRRRSGRKWSAGFTLMEVVVSLAVIAVAATIGASMFASSYALGSDLRDRRAAMRIAEEILTEMQRDPASFTWPAANDQLQPVTKKDGQASVAPPRVNATVPSAERKIHDQYERYTWHAYARLPEGAKTCELSVVVSWTRSQKLHSFSLTSLAPRQVLEGKP